MKARAIMGLAEVFGCREQTVTLPDGARVADLFARLEAKYGKRFAEVCYGCASGRLTARLQVLVNGRNIVFLEGLDTRLSDGDDVFFLPPAMGG